jgi:hypothetical protein
MSLSGVPAEQGRVCPVWSVGSSNEEDRLSTVCTLHLRRQLTVYHFSRRNHV